MQNFQMMLEASVTLVSSTKIQYICTMLHGKALHHIDTLCDQVVSKNTTYLNHFFLFRYILFYFLCVVKAKSRDAPWNEESAKIKSDTLRFSSD